MPSRRHGISGFDLRFHTFFVIFCFSIIFISIDLVVAHSSPNSIAFGSMSHMDANQTNRVAQAYRTLGLKPVTSRHQTAARAFTRHRRKIAAQDERLAQAKEETGANPRIDTEGAFPFMDLPAELRLRVYKLALARPHRLHVEVMRTPNLACTSKQVRQECLPVFLRVNCFQAYYSRGLDGTFGIIFANETLAWLRTLPLTAGYIQDLRVTFQGDIGQGDPRSSVFQIIATATQTFINHVERRCPFCIDGWYGESYKLPHPVYDHPCLRNPPFKLKNAHDMLVKMLETFYFKKSADWGRGGLSITDVIDLGAVADSIKQDPSVFRTFCLSIQKMVDHADQVGLWAAEWTDIMEQSRARQDPSQRPAPDPVEQWLQADVNATDQDNDES